MTTHKLYPDHDPSKLEPHYCAHVSGMTEWGLHAKSDIAIQLAWRDKRIAELEAENARLRDRRFRIMDGPSIPWRMIAPHETQALANHDQTLEQLHGRGGLSPKEAVAVLEGKPWRAVRDMPESDAQRRLIELVHAYENPKLMQLPESEEPVPLLPDDALDLLLVPVGKRDAAWMEKWEAAVALPVIEPKADERGGAGGDDA